MAENAPEQGERMVAIMIVRKKHIFILLGALLALVAAAAVYRASAVRQTASLHRAKIILDAGHGSPDGGAVGAGGIEEKDINIAIVKKLQEVLEGRGYEVILTRDGDSGLQSPDADTIRKKKISDMHNRREIIEKSGADLFLSIHMNSFGDPSVSGLHIFYDKSHPDAEGIAKRIQQEISEVTGAEAHAVKTADESLFLMKNSPIPAILAECGFLSNPEEEKKLSDEEYQAKIAWAIANALESYRR